MKDAKGNAVAVGDVVQIDPTMEDCFFPGCFMQVTEVKSFGAQGFICMPQSRDEPPGQAFFRVDSANMVRIGKAEWIVE